MIFYIATREDGKKIALTVEAEARKIDKSYQTIDQPNDKASLKILLQDSFDAVFLLEQKLQLAQIALNDADQPSAPAVGSDGSQEQVPDTASESPASRQAEPSVRPTYMDSYNEARMTERQNQPKTDEIIDFIFDKASTNQVATILSAIGTRFSELSKENDKLRSA
jgi:dsDNA-binding SOS-regulon protein